MVNIYLIIVVVILTLVIIAANIYVLVYFQHPEDKNVAWFPKIVVILGLTLAAFSILMLPMDVANANTPPSGGGFPMDILWMVVYIVIAVMAVVIIPFAIFYYESEEAEYTDETPSQLASAIKGTLVTLFIFGVITVVMYIFLGIAEIPVIRLQSTLTTISEPIRPEVNETLFNTTDLVYPTVPCDMAFYNESDPDGNCTFPRKKDIDETPIRFEDYLQYRVTIILYIITMVVFLGWILFIIFGGVGMVAFPFDCINSFATRPVRITLDQYSKQKQEIGQRATQLIEIGKAIQEKQKRGKKSRKDRENYNRFRQAVFLLESDYDRMQTCYKQQGGKVILYYLLLILGVIGVFLTILWLLHIILFVFTQPYPFHPFLNDMVRALDGVFGLFGTVCYGLFAFYLLLCVIKGNFKFGMRIFILFPIHPMRVGGTLMNAFLFNTLLILVCAVSITQFCTTAFSDYTSLTAINSMFSMSVRNLRGIKYVFVGYVYAFFIMVFLTAIYLGIKPRERPATDKIVL